MATKFKMIQTVTAFALGMFASISLYTVKHKTLELAQLSVIEDTDAQEGDNILFIADFGYISSVRAGMESQASPNKIDKGSV